MDDGTTTGTDSAVMDASQGTSTVYNGSVPCVGCGSWLSPVAAMYAADSRCHGCRRKRHHRHIKSRMSGR